MPFALLLAMQAAGMVTDYLATAEQQRLGDLGAKLQQASIEANLEQTRLEAEDSSLMAMRQLRKTLGSQIAVFAARGTQTGQGSAVSILNESVSNFNADERMRRMNLLSKENAIKAGSTIAKLNQNGNNTKLWQSFSQRSLNTFPTSFDAWSQGFNETKKSFGLTSIGSE